MRLFGLVLIIAALLTPVFWLRDLIARDPLAIISQYIGMSALIAMSISQILATRWSGLETIFGGLDRIYVIHKWLGILAISAVLIHDTVDADVRNSGPETFLTDIAETLGEFSLYGILILVTITLTTFIPYHLWRWTHKFMGALFVCAAIHYLLIMKPFALDDPLGLYVTGFCIAGMAAYLWTLRPFRRGKPYRVETVESSGGTTSVSLRPVGKGIRHQPGQFAFFRFDLPNRTEVHPFTISSGPRTDRSIRVSMKSLGDYTTALPNELVEGTAVRVEGPYGHFQPATQKTGQIWLAAGIGITPFLAWAEARTPQSPIVDLIYCVRDRSIAPHLSHLESLAEGDAGLCLHVHETATHGHLSTENIVSLTGLQPAQMHVSFCGPASMRKAICKDLTVQGLIARKFAYEEFEIRSGVNFQPLGRWLCQLLKRHRQKQT